MNQERRELLHNLLEKHTEIEGKYNYPIPRGTIQDFYGYFMNEKLDMKIAKKIEDLGFKVIYPAELSEDVISKMDNAEKEAYEYRVNSTLVVEGKEQTPSLKLAKTIIQHYLSTDPAEYGLDKDSNSYICYMGTTRYKEETVENLQELLASVGFEPIVNEEESGKKITVSSSIPYHFVEKDKFEQIYGKADNRKIQNIFAQLKNKDKENERE